MTLASRRLMRKRPFIVSVLGRTGSGDRQRSRGRHEQKRGDESAGKQSGGFPGGGERCEHWRNPFSIWSRTRPSGPCPYHCKGRANSKKACVFNAGNCGVAKNTGLERRELAD